MTLGRMFSAESQHNTTQLTNNINYKSQHWQYYSGRLTTVTQ